MSDIIAGVDGTGPYSNATYVKDFASSFVQRLSRYTAGFAESRYERGPTADGLNTGDLAARAANFAATQYYAYDGFFKNAENMCTTPPRLFLTGYSRGGAAVIEACYLLKAKGIPVHALLLFDAVDRSIVDDRVGTIPSNVRFCIHAVRAKSAESREIFGNCGRKAQSGVMYTEKPFHGTHGAIGGCPWTEAGDDGYIEEVGAGLRSKAASFAAGGVFGLYALNKVDKTKVKLAQEKKAAEDVWKWMQGQYGIAKGTPAK